MSEYIEQLKSNIFSVYHSALKAIRGNTHVLATLDSEDFEYICRAFELFRYGFDDIIEVKRKALAKLDEHMEDIENKDLHKGLRKYISGYLRRAHDPSGFVYVAGSVKIAAKIDLEKIIELLEGKAPESVNILGEYLALLKKMEGASHDAYYILREVGDKFLPNLEQCIYQQVPANQDLILHSLDGFKGNKGVIDFYKGYIEKVKNDWLRDEAENYLELVTA